MTTMTIAQAARHLGLSDMRVRQLVDSGELFVLPGTSPAKLSREHVETQRLLRREALLADLAARRRTPVQLAREARRVLFPREVGANLPQHQAEDQRRRMGLVPSEARQLFGVAAITAACAGEGCRWCLTAEFARLLGGWSPQEYSEGFAALFGQEPCERCGPALYGAVMAALRVRVHPGGERPSEVRSEPARPVTRAEPRPARSQPPTAAQPVQADDGKPMVQARLRDVRAKLKTAERLGDQRYARQLRQTLTALTADAARVDGRDAAPRGRKACGTPVGTRCECHTSDRRRQQ
ncbi:hypothetical protein [Streptomyces sp. NPDC059515]|uniref:hypothetical protein n=1 Tax=Streptomyces sp. NPDC059515 TaxID=3346854 RepID=UPI003678B483